MTGMRKRIYFGLALAVAILALIAGGCNRKGETSSPYGDKRLHPATAELLGDPLYQNIILPDELADRLNKQEDLFVYFFSPVCPHCKNTTPVLAPIAKEFGVDMKMYNVLEFEQGWQDYKIDGTPTLVHFVNGAEQSRVVGAVPADEFRRWFQQELGIS